jgi:hypothetical protein
MVCLFVCLFGLKFGSGICHKARTGSGKQTYLVISTEWKNHLKWCSLRGVLSSPPALWFSNRPIESRLRVTSTNKTPVTRAPESTCPALVKRSLSSHGVARMLLEKVQRFSVFFRPGECIPVSRRIPMCPNSSDLSFKGWNAGRGWRGSEENTCCCRCQAGVNKRHGAIGFAANWPWIATNWSPCIADWDWLGPRWQHQRPPLLK